MNAASILVDQDPVPVIPFVLVLAEMGLNAEELERFVSYVHCNGFLRLDDGSELLRTRVYV